MKKYLNKEERISLLYMTNLIDRCEIIIDDWESRGNLTKEERKCFKMALTWGLKGLEKIVSRLNKDVIAVLEKEMQNSSIHLDRTYSLETIRKKKSADLDAAYHENKEYFKLVELVLDANCKECTKDFEQCEIFKEFETQCIPYMGDEIEGMLNCKYSYKYDE